MTRRIFGQACAFAILAFSLLPACSATNAAAPARLAFVSKDITDGLLALHKGDSSLVAVAAFDSAGNQLTLNASDYGWYSLDPTVLTAKTLGSSALIHGESDWFDTLTPPPDADGGTDASGGNADDGSGAGSTVIVRHASVPSRDISGNGNDPAVTVVGHEPTTMLRVVYGSGSDAPSATVQVAIVLNASGRWQVDINGIGTQELTLEQHGRNVSYVGIGGDASGTITGNQFTLNQLGFVLDGTLSSRTDAAGTYTGPNDQSGTWTAHKLQ